MDGFWILGWGVYIFVLEVFEGVGWNWEWDEIFIGFRLEVILFWIIKVWGGFIGILGC